jgi:hypothetical protein
MMTNNKEINFFDIVKIIKKNYLRIILLSLVILIIPTILIYKNHTKDLYTLKFNYELMLKSSNNLRVANDSINELYHNQLFRGLRYKLDMFYTEFVNSEKKNDVVLSPADHDKINFINNKYILKSLKKSQFIRKNSISVDVKNLEDKDNLFDSSISLSKTIKGDEIKNIETIIANLSDNINKTLIDEIILTIEDAIIQFQIAKNNLIESLKKSNELISESYIFDLKFKIDELENKLQIVKFIESKENTNKFNEYFKSYLDSNSPKGSASEFINLAIPGSGVIQKQIDQLNEKINLSLADLPQVYFNNQLIQLVESEFLKNQIINYDNFPYNPSDLFYLTDYNVVDHSLSFTLAIAYLSFFIIFSLIVAIIFFIILDTIKKYK